MLRSSGSSLQPSLVVFDYNQWQGWQLTNLTSLLELEIQIFTITVAITDDQKIKGYQDHHLYTLNFPYMCQKKNFRFNTFVPSAYVPENFRLNTFVPSAY